MIERLIKYVKGCVLVNVKAFSIERFINICKAKKLVLKDLRLNDEGCSFYVDWYEYKKLLPIAEKTTSIITVEQEYGLPSYAKKYLKHKMFFVGILISYILIRVLSLYVWNIEFDGNSKYTDEALLKYLKSTGIKCGKYIYDIDCNAIETKMRIDFNDIIWVSAEIEGTMLRVHIKENTYTKNVVKEYENCDIIADKDGVISKIVTRSGTAMVKAGDSVKKGDILVKGQIEVYNDYKEVEYIRYVHADASIKVSTSHEIHETLPITYTGKTYTGNEYKTYSVFVNDRLISGKEKIPYDLYDVITEEKQLHLSKSLYLPVTISTKTYKEYTLSEEKYDLDTAKRLLSARIDEYFENLEQLGVVIVEKNVTIDIYNNEYIAIGYIDTIEPIGEDVPIDMIAEEILTE
ncbi:MAG: sporulation protein YqfD [Lachnospiraceae bacterium]|nr:sporulation protein YqfD [Lachnospiraceae bacterium]